MTTTAASPSPAGSTLSTVASSATTSASAATASPSTASDGPAKRCGRHAVHLGGRAARDVDRYRSHTRGQAGRDPGTQQSWRGQGFVGGQRPGTPAPDHRPHRPRGRRGMHGGRPVLDPDVAGAQHPAGRDRVRGDHDRDGACRCPRCCAVMGCTERAQRGEEQAGCRGEQARPAADAQPGHAERVEHDPTVGSERVGTCRSRPGCGRRAGLWTAPRQNVRRSCRSGRRRSGLARGTAGRTARRRCGRTARRRARTA